MHNLEQENLFFFSEVIYVCVIFFLLYRVIFFL
nr:MAG TPA: hypothetical protein [Caudoviricetes sp.]